MQHIDKYENILQTRKNAILKIAKCGCPAAGRAAGTRARRLDRVVPEIARVSFREDRSPPKIAFRRETVTFCASVAPPVGRSENAFGDLSTVGPLMFE